MTMGEKILNMRKARGWSQEELADRVGVTRQAVSRWESGSAKPDADKIIAVCDLFGVSADYLLRDAYSGDTEHRNHEERKGTELGRFFRELSLKQWGGFVILLSSSLVLGVIYLLEKIYPAAWIQPTPEYIRAAYGMMGFLLTHELIWLWVCAWLGLLVGASMLSKNQIWRYCKEKMKKILSFRKRNG